MKIKSSASPLESHFHAIIESSDDAIISKDLAGIITSWNAGAAAIFGYSADEMIGQPMLRLFPQDRLSEEDFILKAIIGGQKVDHFETVRVCKDGRLINISATISPIRNDRGLIVGASKVARDITDKNRYEAIFALSPDGFVTFDRNYKIIHASDAVVDLIDIPAVALIGESMENFFNALNQGSRDDSQLVGKNIFLDISQSQAVIKIYRQNLNGTGPQVLSVQARRAVEGLVSLVICLRDISHESHVERLKSEFMSTAAHELRTPMTSIRGFVELLMLRDDSMRSDERKKLLNIIHQQSLLINSTLDDLLDLNKLESRSACDLQLESLDVRELIHQVSINFHTPLDRLSPILHLDEMPLLVRGDKAYLRRAIMNLISNAYKYSEGLEVVELSAGIDPDNKTLVKLTVADEGVGMSPAQLERYGERFYRADESGAVPGTGLGVSIVKQIVELHGGCFDVQSTLRAGTSVTVRLPLLIPSN